MSKRMNGKLVVVTVCPGGRDSIYVGYAERDGDMLILSRASMVIYYEEVGTTGIADQPEKAARLRPCRRDVIVPLCNVSGIALADEEAWEDHLGVSR